MRETGQGVVRSSILYLLSGFPTEGRQVACVAEGRLVGEGDAIIADCVGVAFAQAVPEAYVGSSKK
jgi:hypothetical protein